MSTKKFIPANNYKEAYKALNAVDSVEADKLPKQINENDKDHYVVALIKRINNEALKKYDTQVSIQQFNARAITKLENGLAFLGFDTMIVLHTPEKNDIAEVDTITKAQDQTPVKSEAQLRKELEDEISAKYAQKYANFVPKQEIDPNGIGTGKDALGNPIGNTDNVILPEDQVKIKKAVETDLTSATVNELKEFAVANEIDIKGLDVKKDILGALQAWQIDNGA